MDRKDEAKHSIGKITIGIREDTLVLEIVAFIRQQLHSWRDDPDRAQEQAENRLNQQMCKFLD